jgi:hypothetical protein
MKMHVVHYLSDVESNRRQLVLVYVWPADKPTLAEKLAMQTFLAAIKRIQKFAKPATP